MPWIMKDPCSKEGTMQSLAQWVPVASTGLSSKDMAGSAYSKFLPGLFTCVLPVEQQGGLAVMGAVLNRIGSSYYLKKIQHDSNILHYKRSPTWRSLVLFTVLVMLTHYISTQAEFWYLGVLCYALGVYFCYIGTEKYEEAVFNKSKGTVSLMNSRLIEKHLIGYRRKIVSELSEIVAVSVESQAVPPGGVGYMVVLLFLSGLTLSLTAQCTFGDKREHEAIAKEIKTFLGLPSASRQESNEGDLDDEMSDGKKNS